jgi:hypothetical protein
MLVVVVVLAVLGAAHPGPTGGDPCRANLPQVCELQRAIDKEHEAANVAAAEADERANAQADGQP